MKPAVLPKNSLAPVLRWAIRLAVVGVLIQQCLRLLDPAVLGVTDFVEYWSAARLNLAGGNPYAPEQLYPLQVAVGFANAHPILMYNPPWALTFVMPFGLPPFAVAQLLWLLVNLLLVFVAADGAWCHCGGPAERRWLAWVIALSFFPTLIALRMGQISVWMLLGVVAFLHFVRQSRDGLAGASLVLAAVKPHLVYLLWPALLLWAVRQRRWKVLAGGVGAGLLATAIPLAWNPELLGQYRHVLTHHPPATCTSPTLGTASRMLLGGERFGLQFVAPLLGLLWFVPYEWKHRPEWDWDRQLPLLLFVSFLTAPYGAWPFDAVVLLPAVLQAAVWTLRCARPGTTAAAIVLFLGVNGLALGLDLWHVDAFWFFWLAPVLLLSYLGLYHWTKR